MPCPWQRGWGQGHPALGAPLGWGLPQTPLAAARVAKLGAHPGAQHPPGPRQMPPGQELLSLLGSHGGAKPF